MNRYLTPFAACLALASCAHATSSSGEAGVASVDNGLLLEALENRVVAHQSVAPGLWPDRSPAALEALHRGNDDLLAQLLSIDAAKLDRASATYDILREQLEAERQYRICRIELWDVNQLSGWHLELLEAALEQPVSTAEERTLALKKWRATPYLIDQELANLGRGLAAGYSAPKSVVRRVIKQVSGLVDEPLEGSALVSPAGRSFDPGFKQAFTALIADDVKPALARYRDYLQKDYLPKARDALGVAAHPDGAQCYQASFRIFTTLNRSAQEVYDLGSRTVESNAAIVADLGERKFGTRELPAILSRIKSAPDNKFTSPQDLIAFARAATIRAREKSTPLFEAMPAQAVLVEPFREYMRGSGASGTYEPQPDLTKPAYYRILTDYWADETRGDTEDYVAHEAYPGHHLQLSLLQTLERSPVAKLWVNAAYTEGWARYSEMLAEEAGIYQTDYVRMSRRIRQARAMVADPGLHVFGWSREQTVDYLVTGGRIRQEAEEVVDRMAIMPGSLATYDTGGLEFIALRDQAQRELGPSFDIRGFHRVVLGQGIVPLRTLRRNVEQWIQDSLRARTGTGG